MHAYKKTRLGRDLVSIHSVRVSEIEGNQVKVKVTLDFPTKGAAAIA